MNWDKVDQQYESVIAQEGRTEKDDPELFFEAQHLGSDVESALTELPEEFRTAIVLVDIEELTYEEAAKIMDCPVGTVRSRLSRGRRILQVMLKDYALERGIKKK